MRRVRQLALLALAVSALLTSGSWSADRQSLPIFDVHIHYNAPDWATYPSDRILAILDGAGIKRALVSSTPDDGTLTLFARDPARIVPILRPYRTTADRERWWDDPSIIAYLEERLRRGVYRGIGEFHLFGDQAKTGVVKHLADLTARENLVLHAHSDESAIVELFRINPKLRILWAHAGMSSSPREVGAMLDRHASLWVDLAIRNDDVAPGGVLAPEWRALLTRHADRFLVGTDTWATSRWESVRSSIAEVRAYLGQLPSEIAEKIAYKNAERLFP